MQLVKRSEIVIHPNRQRKEFDGEIVAGLAQSIEFKQLLHAPVMREEEGRFVLVAGETRIKAMDNIWLLGGNFKFNNMDVPAGWVPYVTMGQLSELEAEEAELEENIKRKDLTWQENAAAMAKLHSLRSRQAQAAGRIHTVADTAMEVKGRSDGAYQESIRKDIIIAKHLHNPLIAKAKDSNEAFKILKKQETTEKNIQLAATIGSTITADTHELHNVNCLAWLSATEASQFDVILTDPPYGMGADSFGDGGGGRLTNNEHHYDDSYESWKTLMTQWAPLAYRVAKEEAHAYVFCDIDNFPELKSIMRAAGWYVFRTPFICTKPNSGRVPLPDQGPRRQWEMILYAIKGKKKTNAIYPDVITTMADPGLTHGAQKPVALYADLLKRSVRPGDVILDSFAGSGTIFAAAQQFKCKAVGLEMNPEYYAICHQRIQALATPAQEAAGKNLMDELLQMNGPAPF
jgi:DNA modification methylase